MGVGDVGIGRTGVGQVNVGVYESVNWFITLLPSLLPNPKPMSEIPGL